MVVLFKSFKKIVTCRRMRKQPFNTQQLFFFLENKLKPKLELRFYVYY
ncbi:hypothetical protein CHCC5023_2645 [Bacillus paralicheniformis]|nr:hypothetical protein CHCC5023_2645 [Bacillus paralicheniformis]